MNIYWAPGVNWSTNEKGLLIETYLFSTEFSRLFPQLYFFTSAGITKDELLASFGEFSRSKLVKFVDKLMELHVLICNIQNIDELFYGQKKLFSPKSALAEDYFAYADNVKEYHKMALRREVLHEHTKKIDVPTIALDTFLVERRSTRDFDTTKIIGAERFNRILNVLLQFDAVNGSAYCYPSAGGLYPIDVYIHVKDGRVENIDTGLYYFDQIRKELRCISDGNKITKNSHYFINKNIFDSSAFSMYLFYNADVSMPKYGHRGYYYGIIDSGIIVGYLSVQCELSGMGMCCIGEMDFDSIASEFPLMPSQKYIHTIEFGLKKDDDNGKDFYVE